MWMRIVDKKEDMHYDDAVGCVDDLLIASKSPQLTADALTNKYNFKLKGIEPTIFHLGCDFTRDSNNDLCLAPRKYVGKMSDSFASAFGSNPKSI